MDFNENVNHWLTRWLFDVTTELPPMQRDVFDSAPQHPGKVLRQMMEERGWTQDDMALITGKSRQSINEIISGRNGMGLEMALLLASAFGNGPSDWLRLDQVYRLSISEHNTDEVREMAILFSVAPIREMIKRGWIRPTMSAKELRQELTLFFESDPLEHLLP